MYINKTINIWIFKRNNWTQNNNADKKLSQLREILEFKIRGIFSFIFTLLSLDQIDDCGSEECIIPIF